MNRVWNDDIMSAIPGLRVVHAMMATTTAGVLSGTYLQKYGITLTKTASKVGRYTIQLVNAKDEAQTALGLLGHHVSLIGPDDAVFEAAPKTVKLTTAAALPANTAAGTGVGATLTADANGVLTVDGVTVLLNDRVFVQPEHANAADQGGIYLCTTEGTAGAAFILTRATDFDAASAGEIANGALIRATQGDTNEGKVFVLTNTAAITVDTTALTFSASGGTQPVLRDNDIASDGTVEVQFLTKVKGVAVDAEVEAGTIICVTLFLRDSNRS